MASLSGTFSSPGATASLPCSGIGGVTITVDGEFPRAVIHGEFSTDGGVTWTKSLWASDLGITGASKARYDGFGASPPRAPGAITVPATGTLVRLNCIEWASGWCNWTLST